jgi:hypothetical protein
MIGYAVAEILEGCVAVAAISELTIDMLSSDFESLMPKTSKFKENSASNGGAELSILGYLC